MVWIVAPSWRVTVAGVVLAARPEGETLELAAVGAAACGPTRPGGRAEDRRPCRSV